MVGYVFGNLVETVSVTQRQQVPDVRSLCVQMAEYLGGMFLIRMTHPDDEFGQPCRILTAMTEHDHDRDRHELSYFPNFRWGRLAIFIGVD